MDEAFLQDSNSNDLIIPRDEFTFISDPDSLEDIVIYDMVGEYQAVVTVKKNKDEDIIEIKPEPQERCEPSNKIMSDSQPETTTMSQIIVDHEEIVSAQEPTLEKIGWQYYSEASNQKDGDETAYTKKIWP